jgi:STE24 endopeptidase
VGLITGIPFAILVLWLMEYIKEFWWLYVWIYPILIAPLFNQFQPLKNEDLKKALRLYCTAMVLIAKAFL